MRSALWGVLALAACGSNNNNGYPVGGGSGGDGGVIADARHVDAHPDAAHMDAHLIDALASPIDAYLFSGRVCLLADPRMMTTCTSTGVGGLTVRIGTSVATTAADGSFTIVGQSTGTWTVTGANIATSVLGYTDYLIPAISLTTYNALKANNGPTGGVVIQPGQGSLMINVLQNGLGMAGDTGFSTPTSVYEPIYDGSTATSWTQGSSGTGSNGAVWLAGIDVGTATASITVGTLVLTTPSLPIIDDSITFATVVFP